MIKIMMPKNVKPKENTKALKHLIDQKLLRRISNAIFSVYPQFDKKNFNALMPRLKDLEMKSRVYLLREELKKQLPQDYKKAVNILLKSTRIKTLRGFDLWPYTEFIQTYGLNDVQVSLKALREITGLFTSEWAVRPFIKNYRFETLSFLLKCAADCDEHVRRWACEGSRPRLPWGERLFDIIKDPNLTLPLLEKLKTDDSLYVRKSVSNHLNDLAKDHPDLVIKLLNRWKSAAPPKDILKIKWIINRALRTLIKQGHPGALASVGVDPNAKIQVSKLVVQQNKIKLGEDLKLQFQLASKSNKIQKVVIDYIIHFAKANGTAATKVFKLKTFEMQPMKKLIITKTHSFKKIRTRQYYPGLHVVEIQINGKRHAKISWHLKI